MTWQENLRKVEPYTAGEQPKISHLIKLNTNENPYGPSPEVKRALEKINFEQLRLYPSTDSTQLRAALAEHYGLSPQQVFVGNGSDEVLALSFLTFFNGRNPVLFPDITYSFYPVYCQLFGIDYRKLAVDEELRLREEDYFQKNSGIIFPNPNAPTGLLVSLEFIESILRHNPDSMVIIDEAYIDFGGISSLPLLAKYNNLVIAQSFSKSRALAGIRLGVALGNVEAIARLYDVKNSFNSYPVDTIAQQVGLASLADQEYFEKSCQKIIRTREYFKQELKKLGFIVPDSYANFVFARHPSINAPQLFSDLRQAGILVRHWDKPGINRYLRISIGTDEQMAAVIKFLQQYQKGR